MRLIKVSKNAFTHEEIYKDLLELRAHCLNDSSGFAVTALGIYKVGDSYIRIAGVNIENQRFNRLGLHAEHSVLANAQALLGHKAKLEKLYVMGAPNAVNKEATDGSADHFCMMCGNCRQLVLSLSAESAEMQSVTLSGKFSKAEKIKDQLPNAFSERDLLLPESSAPSEEKTANDSSPKAKSSLFFVTQKYEITDLPSVSMPLPHTSVLTYLRLLQPHIVDPKFKTSNINSCLLRVSLGDKTFHAAGTLVQDIAFLTAEALSSALAFAITENGHKGMTKTINAKGEVQEEAQGICFEEVYLYADKHEAVPLYGEELDMLARYSKGNNPNVHIYTKEGSCKSYTLSECMDAFRADMFKKPEKQAVKVEEQNYNYLTSSTPASPVTPTI